MHIVSSNEEEYAVLKLNFVKTSTNRLKMIRMRFFNVLVPLLAIVTLFSSCSFQDLEIRNVENFEIEKTENGKVEGVMKVRIYNPNNFAITVTNADLDVFAANVRVGDAHLSKKFKISAKSEETYDIEVDANIQNLLTGGLGSLVSVLSGKKPKVMLEGELKARSFLISKTIPIKLETEIPLNF